MKIRELNNKYEVTNVRWGVVRTNNLSNELDSATIVLTHISSINIEPFDIVELTNENNELEFWLVANPQKTYVTYTAPFIFDYTVDIISPTKLFEMDSLPNMAITNIGQNRSINYYINEVYNKYFKSYNLYKNIVTLAVDASTSNVQAKEYVFQGPTLREFLDALYSQVGAIAKLKITKNSSNSYTFEVVPFYLKASDQSLPIANVDNIVGANSMDSYITSIKNEAKIIGSPAIEYHTPISEEVLSNTDNVKLMTNNSIYDVVKMIVKNIKFSVLYLTEVTTTQGYYQNDNDTPVYKARNVNYFVGLPTGSGQDEYPDANGGDFYLVDPMDIDISDYIVAAEIFNTLETLQANEVRTKINQYYNSNYKNNSIYFSRGQTSIENLVYFESKHVIWWDNNDEPAIVNAIMCAAYKVVKEKIESGTYNFSYVEGGTTYYVSYFATNPTTSPFAITDPQTSGSLINWADNYKTMLFQIQYKPYVNIRYAIDKDKNMHLASSVEGASNVNTDITLAIKQGYEKIKQLANDSLILTGYSKVANSDYTPVFKIGQVFQDESNNEYVLTTLEWQTSMNSIKYKGTLSKNYSSNILNTMINREKRYYALADVSDTIDRHEVIKREFILSTAQTEQLYAAKKRNNDIIGDLSSYVLFYTEDNISTPAGNNVYGSLPVTTIKTKDLVIYNFSFKDNVSFGEVITDSFVAATSGGYINQIKKYVDENGEISRLWYALGTDKDSDPASLAKYEYSVNAVPSIGVVQLDIKKDNREQLVVSHQVKITIDSSLIEMFDVDWDAILKNGGIDDLNTYLLDFTVYDDESNPTTYTANTSNIFGYDFNSNAGYQTLCKIYVQDKNSQQYLLMELNIPADYTGSLFLHGELGDLD